MPGVGNGASENGSNGVPEHEKPGFSLESLVPDDAFKDDDGAEPDAPEAAQPTFEVDEGDKPRAGATERGGGGGVRVVIFRTLDDPESSKLATVIGGFIMLLIFLGSVTFVLESLPDVKQRWNSEMQIFESICVMSFTLDYVLRVLTCTTRPGPNGLVAYLVQPLNLVDIASILPWYMERLFQMGGSMSILRVLRMARIFRYDCLSLLAATFASCGCWCHQLYMPAPACAGVCSNLSSLMPRLLRQCDEDWHICRGAAHIQQGCRTSNARPYSSVFHARDISDCLWCVLQHARGQSTPRLSLWHCRQIDGLRAGGEGRLREHSSCNMVRARHSHDGWIW